MLLHLFYTLNVLLCLSGLLHYQKKSHAKQFTLALIQTLFSLPLLACEYLYLAFNSNEQAGQLIFFSEIIFILIWLSLAIRMLRAAQTTVSANKHLFTIEFLAGLAILSLALYFLTTRSVFDFSNGKITFPHYGVIYFSTLLTLFTTLYSSWKIEAFWQSLDKSERWKYKFFVVGCFLICGSFAWSCSYRLTYMLIYKEHLLLLSSFLFFGWLMMIYDIAHYKLLKRTIYISRKVIYSFVFPTLLAMYFFAFGVITITMKTFGVEMFFVLKWLLTAFGLVVIVLFGFSGKIRRRGHFFISTYFYTNKYEYRDEWLALSEHLQGAQNETEVIQALRDVLTECLYTVEIFIWIGGSENNQDFKLISWDKDFNNSDWDNSIPAEDALIRYLGNHSYFHIEAREHPPQWAEVREKKRELIDSLQLKLIAPISIHNHLSGLIGLGAEYTAGEYSYDDFDLLKALGSQTASALLAIRIAEELAKNREQQAWSRLSTFVLHDIKNAATMLSLLQENAPAHIHEPEFQNDMLELVDDTLIRMKRVEERLGTLKEDIELNLQDIALKPFLVSCSQHMMKQIPSIQISVTETDGLSIHSDPDLLHSILENLFINASQAQENCHVEIKTSPNIIAELITVTLSDNGPGIAKILLPEALFEPFRTTKDGGSGIGLWQVKKLLTNMGGDITAQNIHGGGAQFTIRLPRGQGVE
ncbi:MAG: hypothetical protein COA36_15465 [Desulfotalea sp.]|nr:MAG: hypothetical protein COA36_15465 [Desulfotalea sp.]